MGNKKQSNQKSLHEAAELFVSGIFLFVVAYVFFSLALGSASYLQWILAIAGFVWGFKRIIRAFRLLTVRS